MQAAYPALKDFARSVVNLGTGSALRNDLPGFALYAGTKEMIRTLTRMAALEWVRTASGSTRASPTACPPASTCVAVRTAGVRDFVSTIPLGRVGRLEEDVGRAVAFLLSEDAAYVTGSTLMADGGQAYLR